VTVTNWIVVLVLYVIGFGLFALLGGVRSAGEALRRWGESSSAIRRDTTSS
jgi:hypothetical protein